MLSSSQPPTREELLLEAVASLELLREGRARDFLAEQAVWLALANLGDWVREDLDALAAGTFWQQQFPVPGTSSAEPVELRRTAAGLILLRHAGGEQHGAAERTLAALAAVTLGCADPRVGQGLQRELGRLELLELIEQIPVAAQVRTLALEFRHLLLREGEDVPAALVARVEDLLERFDRERLVASLRADLQGETDGDEAALQALIRSRSPHLTSLARVLLHAAEVYLSDEALWQACCLDTQRLWGRQTRQTALRLLETCYGQLRERLSGTAYALCSRAAGRYGLESLS